MGRKQPKARGCLPQRLQPLSDSFFRASKAVYSGRLRLLLALAWRHGIARARILRTQPDQQVDVRLESLLLDWPPEAMVWEMTEL